MIRFFVATSMFTVLTIILILIFRTFVQGGLGFFGGLHSGGVHPHPSGRGFLRRRVNLGIAPPCVPSGLMMFSVGTARGPYCSVGPHETWRGQVSLVVSWRYVDTFEESLQYSYQKG